MERRTGLSLFSVGWLLLAAMGYSLPMSAQSVALAQAVKEAAQPVHLTLRMDGLYPKAVSVVQGRVEVILSNPTFLSTFDIALIDGAGKGALQTTNAVAAGGLSGRHSLTRDLQPGVYTVGVVGHPEWAAVLTVTAKGK